MRSTGSRSISTRGGGAELLSLDVALAEGHFAAEPADALARDSAHFGYAEAGAAVGLSENAVKKAVFRLRTKYRELLKQEIADTLSRNDAVEVTRDPRQPRSDGVPPSGGFLRGGAPFGSASWRRRLDGWKPSLLGLHRSPSHSNCIVPAERSRRGGK